jgi:hypothetical protein
MAIADMIGGVVMAVPASLPMTRNISTDITELQDD